MTKRCITFEFSDTYCRVAQARRTANGVYVEKAGIIPGSEYSNLSEKLSEMGFNMKLPAVFTVSPDKCHYLNVDSDVDLTTSIDDTAASSSAIKHSDAVQIHLPQLHKLAGHNPSSLVISVEKDEIYRIANLCKEHGIFCARIDIPLFAMKTAISFQNDTEVTDWMQLYVSDDRVSITTLKEGDFLIVRNIPLTGKSQDVPDIVAREIQLTWRAAHGSKLPEDTHIVMLNTHPDIPELEASLKSELNCKLFPLAELPDMQFDSSIENPGQYTIAATAANIFFRPNNYSGIDLLKSLNEDNEKQSTVSQLKYTVILVLILLILFISNLQLKHSKLADTNKQLTQKIETLFNETVPGKEASNLVPKMMLSIMKENDSDSDKTLIRLKEIVSQKYRLVPVFNAISSVANENINIREINVENQELNLKVSAETKEAINNFKVALKERINIPTTIQYTNSTDALISVNIEKINNEQ